MMPRDGPDFGAWRALLFSCYHAISKQHVMAVTTSSSHSRGSAADAPAQCSCGAAGSPRIRLQRKSRVRRVFPLCLGTQTLLPSLCLSCKPVCCTRSPTLLTPALTSQLELGPAWSLWTCLAIGRLLADICHHLPPGPTFLVGYHGDCASW